MTEFGLDRQDLSRISALEIKKESSKKRRKNSSDEEILFFVKQRAFIDPSTYLSIDWRVKVNRLQTQKQSKGCSRYLLTRRQPPTQRLYRIGALFSHQSSDSDRSADIIITNETAGIIY